MIFCCVEKDDMEITRDISLDEETIKGYPDIDPSAYGYCKSLLKNVMNERKEDSVNTDIIEEAIGLLHNNFPIYK